MQRIINSRDVIDDTHSRDIQLTKDEDIEYRSGTLYSSSGTTFVEILQERQQHLADKESNRLIANGSYTLEKMQCYTLSKSAAAHINKRSVDNMVETSLKATINKRKYTCTLVHHLPISELDLFSALIIIIVILLIKL